MAANASAPTFPQNNASADIENALHLVGLDAVAYAPLLAPMVDIPLPRGARGEFRAGGIAGAGNWRR